MDDQILREVLLTKSVVLIAVGTVYLTRENKDLVDIAFAIVWLALAAIAALRAWC